MASPALGQMRGCYFQDWSQGRGAPGKFSSTGNYVWGVCTHIYYAFAQISGNTLVGPPGAGTGYSIVKHFKDHNPSLKILLSVGGDTAANSFIQLTSNAGNVATWAKNAVNYAKNNGFDGLDIDWEFPVGRKDAFTTLIKSLRAAAPKGFLITAAMSADVQSQAQNSYNLGAIKDSVDFFNIMTYEYHGKWDRVTGHNSALGTGTGDTWTIQWTMNYYLAQGVPAKKLVLGIPAYARGWTLASSAANQGPGAAAIGASNAGPLTKDPSNLAFYELCKQNGPTKYDSSKKASYKQVGNQWFSVEDFTSLSAKVNWLKSKGLAGTFIWALDFDDFTNYCGQGRYPVQNGINKVLMGRTWN